MDINQLSKIVKKKILDHDIIEDVHGRVGKLIRGYSSKYPSLVLYYIFKNLAIEHKYEYKYQAFQFEAGKIKFCIQEKLSIREKGLISVEAKKYFGEDLKIFIEDNAKPEKNNGKLIDFISMI